jgi:hypothetical protein
MEIGKFFELHVNKNVAYQKFSHAEKTVLRGKLQH